MCCSQTGLGERSLAQCRQHGEIIRIVRWFSRKASSDSIVPNRSIPALSIQPCENTRTVLMLRWHDVPGTNHKFVCSQHFVALNTKLQASKRSYVYAWPHLEQLPVELKQSFVVSDVHLFHFFTRRARRRGCLARVNDSDILRMLCICLVGYSVF